MRYVKLIFVLVSFLLCASLAYGADKHGEEKHEAFDPLEMIMHHISDNHDWHIVSYVNSDGKDVHISLPLPIILIYEGEWHVFMSSAFEHGHKVVQKGDVYFVLNEQNIYVTDACGTIHRDEQHNVLNEKPWDLSVTQNVASMFLSVGLLLAIFISVARKYRTGPSAPKGLQSLLEPLILFVRDDIAVDQIGKEKADRYLPFLLTVFFFIWINNLIGLVPFFPGGSNLTGNISVTMLLALLTFFIVNFSGTKTYWKHIFWMSGVPVPIRFLLSIVEFVGIFTKPFALMIRLMANITAGHIIILSLFSLIFVLKSLAIAPLSIMMALMMFMLELLVGVLQAYIFTLLSALFIGMAVHQEEH